MKKNNKKRIRLLSILLAVVAAIALYSFLGGKDEEVEEESYVPATVTVVVAAVDIPADTIITEEHIKLVETTEDKLIGGAMNDASYFIGSVLKKDVTAEAQLSMYDMMILGDRNQGHLALIIEEGYRAFTLPVNVLTGVNNMIHPGDYVDVIAHMPESLDADAKQVSQTLLEKIEVLAVDAIISESGAVEGYSALTLMLTPRQVAILDYATFNASLRVVLRSPIDEGTGKQKYSLPQKASNATPVVAEPVEEVEEVTE